MQDQPEDQPPPPPPRPPPEGERRHPPPVQEVRLRPETLAHLEAQIAQAVSNGIRGAITEETAAAFWGAGLDLLQRHATQRAGQIVIGGLWGLLQRIMLFVMLGGLVYSVGGWSALDKLFRTVFGGGAP